MMSYEKKQEEGTSAGALKSGGMDRIIEEKSRLIDSLAYQIRTLSNAIIGFSDLLMSENLDETQQEYISEIRQAGRGLSCLMDDVLDLARIQAGKLKPVIAECGLADFLKKLETPVMRAAQQKDLDFRIETSAGLPARIRTDFERLLKCVLNLAGNAVKYTFAGSVTVRISMDSSKIPGAIRFDVVDTGIGISSDELEKVFEPSRQFEKTSSGMLSSLNLGLRICGGLTMTRQIIELLGGWMEVVSEPGVGSTFSIVVPSGVEGETKPGFSYQSAAQDETSASVKRQCLGHILLVEDEESNRTVLTLMLEGLGLRVTTAVDGQDAVETAMRESFDLILMDIHLPRLNGCEALKQLQANGLAIPVIALSAGVTDDTEQAELESLFHHFLSKPVDSSQLTEVLERYLPTVSQPVESRDCRTASKSEFPWPQ